MATLRTPGFHTDPEPEPDALGPCGCVDYHMADCPLVTERHGPQDEPEPYDYEDFHAQYDDDPNPYHGTYSEE